ncbi:hypothetical protein DPMN_085786 [Dreissena polymorpha]|uniref:Uncharacterized protein n=1 Tax=Dreissena polymorpha TaxID=45954 RepID=A0A9D3YH49_DREPO|nr:hypothetical protein DPMN_085786 [Dreissena polymorpha]
MSQHGAVFRSDGNVGRRLKYTHDFDDVWRVVKYQQNFTERDDRSAYKVVVKTQR